MNYDWLIETLFQLRLYSCFFFFTFEAPIEIQMVLDRPVKMSQMLIVGSYSHFSGFTVGFEYIDIFIYSAFNIFDPLDR